MADPLVFAERRDLSGQTLHIRIAGVDAPEVRLPAFSSRSFVIALNIASQLGHFGKSVQPFAQDSLRWLKAQIEGKTVYCQLLQRDQYRRIVSAHAPPSSSSFPTM